MMPQASSARCARGSIALSSALSNPLPLRRERELYTGRSSKGGLARLHGAPVDRDGGRTKTIWSEPSGDAVIAAEDEGFALLDLFLELDLDRGIEIADRHH